MASSNKNNTLLVERARSLFTERAIRMLPELISAIEEKLSLLASQPGGPGNPQDRRDAWLAFRQSSAAWLRGTASAWTAAQSWSPDARPSGFASSGQLELMGNEVMEDKILASRLALRLLDFASWELNDLRLRVQNLDGISELHKKDIFRPEVLAQHLVEQWTQAALPRDAWLMVQDVIQKTMAEHLLEIYHATNEFLVGQGVMVEIDLRKLVRRTPSANGGARVETSSPPSGGFAAQSGSTSSGTGLATAGGAGSAGGGGGGGGGASGYSPGSRGGGASSGERAGPASGPATSGSGHLVHEETRMQTGTTPLARARMRAQGVVGHLKRLLSDRVAGFDDTRPADVSPQLTQALASVQAQDDKDQRTLMAQAPGQVFGPAQVEQAMGSLRERTSALKQAAASPSEKATIEIVALMFQSILAEERIAPVIRVWFARLQMPVLRLAITEPEFFGSLQHPARRLIDRMGSCVLGFDVAVSGGAMEAEVRRVVQVVEQYPETGRRVFQLVYDEFEKFLSKFLSGQGSAAKVVSVAQQVEQKETMAIQYTIEMRNMLNDMPVRTEIREFLFKVWAEALAIAAVRYGPQQEQTLTLKRAAAELVWSASAKPNREDRARVIADLPKLLQLLRQGMALLSMPVADQDQHLKTLSDTLADAFMSRTDAIPMERIVAMAKRLSNLEDYLSDEDVGELPLDVESLVTMIGIDAAEIQVITDGGSQPTDAMRGWVRELQLGAWFSLDHNGKSSDVQFAWCSERKQLHLFAAADGRNFLIQASRLAAYLQAGLLVPAEEEALTVRATRDALAKLDANPERLLA